jgi:hypothetical protein
MSYMTHSHSASLLALGRPVIARPNSYSSDIGYEGRARQGVNREVVINTQWPFNPGVRVATRPSLKVEETLDLPSIVTRAHYVPLG